ncbi:MAG: hypothetical protein ACE15C_14620 [Phycisphaerae bacterium]
MTRAQRQRERLYDLLIQRDWLSDEVRRAQDSLMEAYAELIERAKQARECRAARRGRPW